MYLDTCVLAKLFMPESDSEECAAKIPSSTVVSSELVYGEIFSALLKKERLGEISETYREEAWARFERKIQEGSLWLAPLDGVIVRRAKEVMLEVHPNVAIRTLDAIHLATYRAVVAGPLFTMDQRMRNAAEALNIPLVSF